MDMNSLAHTRWECKYSIIEESEEPSDLAGTIRAGTDCQEFVTSWI